MQIVDLKRPSSVSNYVTRGGPADLPRRLRETLTKYTSQGGVDI